LQAATKLGGEKPLWSKLLPTENIHSPLIILFFFNNSHLYFTQEIHSNSLFSLFLVQNNNGKLLKEQAKRKAGTPLFWKYFALQ
jgi:hypothetical protein